MALPERLAESLTSIAGHGRHVDVLVFTLKGLHARGFGEEEKFFFF